MKMLKFFVFAPKDEKIVDKIIKAAAKGGAGKIGNYTQCAFVIEGTGTWKPEKGANPYIGKVGKLSKEPEVRIEMECPRAAMSKVFKELKKVHPYDKLAIDAVIIERFEEK